MGSNVKRMAILMVIVMIAAVVGIVLYDNRDSLRKEREAEAMAGQEAEETPEAQAGQIGEDTRAFLTDETFFDPDKLPYSSIEMFEGKMLSLLMTSVQRDLRIQIVDNAGNPVTGETFCVVLNKGDEYTDEDQDGIIHIEHLRAGDYAVELKEIAGYIVPNAPAQITVKQNVEYVVIDDISLLIYTEDEINAELEDLEVNGAQEDADTTEITRMQEGKNNAKFGIDVSKWNKEIDWDRVKQAGVEFAIIRLGYRGATTGALVEDPYFEKNMKGAASAGIPVGVYFFTQAVDAVEAVEEASMVITLCRDYKLDYPVFIDTEGLGGNGRADGLDIEARTGVCAAFCKTIEGAGYRAGVYSSRNWYNGMLDVSVLNDYIIWLAEYRDSPLYQGYYHMWQYTSGGKVDGIEGNVDFNLSYLRIEDTKTAGGEEEGTYLLPEGEVGDREEAGADSNENEGARSKAEASVGGNADNRNGAEASAGGNTDNRSGAEASAGGNTDNRNGAEASAGGNADNRNGAEASAGGNTDNRNEEELPAGENNRN